MNLYKKPLSQMTASPPEPEAAPSFYRRLTNSLSTVILRPWIQENLLSRRIQILIDAIVSTSSFILAHILRFDGWPPGVDNDRVFLVLPYLLVARIGVNYLMGLYRRVWRYVSIPDSIHLAASVGIISAVMLALRLLLAPEVPLLAVPISIIIMDFVLTVMGMLAARMSWRMTVENAARVKRRRLGIRQRTLLVGAGDAGIMAVREIARRSDLGLQVCGFLDDNQSKQNTVIQGIQVLGATADLPSIVRSHRIDQVIITMASARRKTIRRILDLCDESHVPVKIIPALYEILGNNVTVSSVRPVEIEDLLGRDAIDVNVWLEANRAAYRGKRVLVTGAGGSIGRELCRQLMVLEPDAILVLDKDENSVFEAERELRAQCEEQPHPCRTEIVPVICDLRFPTRLQQVFRRHAPQIVFHAAAHKHVPLMESNAAEAVLNNILGTQRLLVCAAQFAVERCVMVSTDKAVNPTNIMGATKRVAELMFQAQAAQSAGRTSYSCVRFGNVLGSRGSVIPIFREQIRTGGPITVTHPEVERYFMTIPEAAQLIIQAGAMGQKGEIYLLDMGEPVKVVELAMDMIRLSGLTLGEDIDLEFTGLRPGEKLKEELLIAEEGAQTTKFEKIFVAPPLRYDFDRLSAMVSQLAAAAEEGNDPSIYDIFSRMEIGFHPAAHARGGATETAQASA